MNYKRLLFAVITMAFFISCEKDESGFESEGIITGPDIAMCICCGGYIIEISDSSYHFDFLPASSGIDLPHENFPIHVTLNWQYERICGNIQYIEITAIKKK